MIETPRLRGERIRPEHRGELLELLGDPRVGATMGGAATPESVDRVIAWHMRAWAEDGFHFWLFRDRVTGEVVGRGGLGRTDTGGPGGIEVGWTVRADLWGRGYASEIGAASLEVAFGVLGATEVVSYTLPHNAASRRVMEKLGFGYVREVVHAGLPHVLYRLQSPGST